MTATVQPLAAPDRLPLVDVYTLIAEIARDQKLPAPYSIRKNDPDLLVLSFSSGMQLHAWRHYLAPKALTGRTPVRSLNLVAISSCFDWQGWAVEVCATDPIVEPPLPVRVPGAALGDVPALQDAEVTA